MNLSRFNRAFLLTALTLGTSAQELLTRPSASSAPRQQNFVIGVDDTVTIVANKADDLSKAWRVGVSGALNLPLVGRIQAAGMTVEQFEAELQNRLKEYLINPQVVVYLSEFRSMPVTVTGGVEHPGVIQVQGARGLFDVVMRAGGPKGAGEIVTVTRRLENGKIAHPGAYDVDGTSTVQLALADILEGRGVAADLTISAGDVIHVSDVRPQRLVYIIGAVNKPGMIELVRQDKVSLLNVVAVAGGFTALASRNSTYIRRPIEGGLQAKMVPVHVGDILKGKSPDVDLLEGDMVVVPTSKVAPFLQALPTSGMTTGLLMLARF